MFTLIIVALMTAGILLGYHIFSRLEGKKPIAAVQSAQKAGTFVLLFAMGVWLGGNDAFWEQLQVIGFRGAILAISATVLSIAGVWTVSRLVFRKKVT